MPDQLPNPIPGGCNVGCGSCAYREASITRHEPYNALRALICALGGIPFYCHQGFDWRTAKGRFPAGAPRKVCEGWKREVALKAKDPEWRKTLWFRRAIAELTVGAVEQFVSEEDPGEKKRLLRVMQRGIRKLAQKRLRVRLGARRQREM